MKNIFYPIIALLLTTWSCKNVLDIDDLNSLDESKVWSDSNLVKAYVTNLYPLFGNWSSGADNNSEQLIGIAFPLDAVTVNNTAYKAWDYTTIRRINTAIQKVKENTTLSANFKNSIISQALFMRAYMYFNMVKYHGGVPYITAPQDLEKDDLETPRNTTKECFEFIIKDLDEAIALLPPTIPKSSADYGRIDGNFAVAFKAKVLLYKASPQFNPANPYDNAYWADAHVANKAAYDRLKANGYSLTTDYANIALQEKGPEVVFAVINAYPNKVAAWDNGVRPGSESRGAAGAVPSWDFVKAFPMKDGRLFSDPAGKYYKSDAAFLQSYWENRDPRFDKSIVWNGKLYEVSGKAGKRQYTAVGIAADLDNFGVNPKANTPSENLNRYSGFFILKNSKLSLKQTEVETQYDVDYVLMRFAEVMMNYAETANETGDFNTALDILKQIRMRAGIEAGADGKYGIVATNRIQMRDAILAERNIEFCFEGHRFWDLRRSGKLSVLNNTTKYGVEAIAINSNGTEMDLEAAAALAKTYQLRENQFKYSVLQVPNTGNKVNLVPDKYYFFPIAQSVIDKNPKIIQNKDWGGSFDPTIQ
ncbi:RagB/SusD family nutrient uptake outer membrane protein [Sphingobacterium spiritivorum]|uniref:SusD family protein n=1 Tax=Sphingobacterium spiritivorum ATCC 33861 TaxID=525373 RepID=D7VGM0_SPHSI|nr:RagB/SusD family nutrient uptake outer membrane protein [Sphingobacterium spiritivorum]EFK59222.1 SusD family protein [Sphingobacterium spiritivorum ATCC 33861]QQT34074.1 RagB/SusD family nutrient uptake outer membrane protein [Sphingobacterium spiritivorum]WQD34904.1 RagB/SusD family nutrient uptake outer membrane protein [Sphingobacterium spiritivorum]SUI98634.1 SusD family [Sphingobacterium spiritivorum]